MATCRWRGDAAAVAQVDTYVVTTYDVTTTWKITINGKVISQVGTGGTATTTATALLALLQASTVPPEFAEITWTSNGATITATSAVAGRPFTISATVSGGTGSWVHTSVTTSSGPNDVNVAANWTTAATPANGDDLVVDAGSDLLYNLGALSAIALTSLTVAQKFTGKIGLPPINSTNSAPGQSYFEYRATYFAIQTSTLTIGKGDGGGMPR